MWKVKILYTSGATDLLERSTEPEAREAVSAATLKMASGQHGIKDITAWEVVDGRASNRLYRDATRVQSLDSIEPHPWASTPEALQAARNAIEIPKHLMSVKAAIAGDDELYAQALVILQECARHRGGGAHVGSMWRWPETERSKWAVREIGYCLNNYLRTRVVAA
jgi:hypothetical protein